MKPATTLLGNNNQLRIRGTAQFPSKYTHLDSNTDGMALSNALTEKDSGNLSLSPVRSLSLSNHLSFLRTSSHSESPPTEEGESRFKSFFKRRPSERMLEPKANSTIPVFLLSPGVELLRVTHKKKAVRVFQINVQENTLRWNNKASSYLKLDKIKYIRAGKRARNYREEFKVGVELEEQWLTIIYYNENTLNNNLKALHVMAIDSEQFQCFSDSLSSLVSLRRELNKSLSRITDNDLFIKFHWTNYTNDSTIPYDHLDFDGVAKLSKRLDINTDMATLSFLFRNADLGGKGHLTFPEFQQFVELLKRRKEIEQIFLAITDGRDTMSLMEFYKFITTTQGENLTFEQVSKIVSHKEDISLGIFIKYLSSSKSAPLKSLDEDFSRPLNEYFISSSHNTYLLGSQIRGASSMEGYVKALQKGCRCLEIDIWDGSDNEPIVKHGRAFTSGYSLYVILETIRKYGFITSPYPIVLSLEVHCNYENQLKVRNWLIEVFDDMLVTCALDLNSLPSPAQLKHKVLIKVKKASIFSGSQSTSSSSYTSSFSEDNSLSSSAMVIPKTLPKKPPSKNRIAVELSLLGVYFSSIKFQNFYLPESKDFNHCFSFSEKSINKILKEETQLRSLKKHNVKFLMRVYPWRYRLSSTNFNPLIYWANGVQMCATNWQTFDLGQQVNESMFNIGSKAGYVLKPQLLRLTNKEKRQLNYSSICKFKITLNLISAQQLPRPKDCKDSHINPFIEAEVYGGTVSVDDVVVPHGKLFETSVIPRNGFNPIWNESVTFSVTSCDELVFLKLHVKSKTSDEKDEQIGTYVVKMDYLKKGYRHLPLYDLQGEEYPFSSLFVEITKHPS